MIDVGPVQIPCEVFGLCPEGRGHSVLWNVIVILKFHVGEEIIPVVLPLVNKETKELFQLLVDPLCYDFPLLLLPHYIPFYSDRVPLLSFLKLSSISLSPFLFLGMTHYDLSSPPLYSCTSYDSVSP